MNDLLENYFPYRDSDNILDEIFKKNRCEWKVSWLNSLYACNLMFGYSGGAKVIDFDQAIKKLEEYSDYIAKAESSEEANNTVIKLAVSPLVKEKKKGRNTFGLVFASKYCHFSKPIEALFVIYDTYAEARFGTYQQKESPIQVTITTINLNSLRNMQNMQIM